MYLRKRVLNAALRPLVPLVLRAPPPLNHVRLRSENSQLDLSVTDGATWLSMSVACEGGDLDATIPAGPLRDFIAGADRDSCVEFVGHGRHVDVAFELCLTTFDTASLDDIPRRPDEASSTVWRRDAEWDAGALRDALAWVLGRPPTAHRPSCRTSFAVVHDRRRNRHGAATRARRWPRGSRTIEGARALRWPRLECHRARR